MLLWKLKYMEIITNEGLTAKETHEILQSFSDRSSFPSDTAEGSNDSPA